MTTAIPPEVLAGIQNSRVQAFSHDIVMDAIDISMAVDRHVLLYGVEGLFLLETEDASWRLPPSRVAWVPAGVYVVTTSLRPVRCTSMFFKPDFAPSLAPECCVFSVNPVVREMIRYASRWTIGHTDTSVDVERYLLTLLDVCRTQLLESKAALSLPKARSEELVTALSFTQAHLGETLQLEDAAKEVAMSPRTFMRRMSAELHMTWGEYLRQARMIRAMEHLSGGMQVTETAFEVGYNSIPAFSTAFRKAIGVTPTEYRAQF